MENQKKKCCICEKEIAGTGNNPWPLQLQNADDAECCNECTQKYVNPISCQYDDDSSRYDYMSAEQYHKYLDEFTWSLEEYSDDLAFNFDLLSYVICNGLKAMYISHLRCESEEYWKVKTMLMNLVSRIDGLAEQGNAAEKTTESSFWIEKVRKWIISKIKQDLEPEIENMKYYTKIGNYSSAYCVLRVLWSWDFAVKYIPGYEKSKIWQRFANERERIKREFINKAPKEYESCLVPMIFQQFVETEQHNEK